MGGGCLGREQDLALDRLKGEQRPKPIVGLHVKLRREIDKAKLLRQGGVVGDVDRARRLLVDRDVAKVEARWLHRHPRRRHAGLDKEYHRERLSKVITRGEGWGCR